MSSFPLPTPGHHEPQQGMLVRREARVWTGGVSPCKVAIVGFGTVGRSVAKILCERSPDDLRLTHVCSRTVKRSEVAWLPREVCWSDDVEEVLAADVDVIVEVVGGLNPAGDWIRKALVSGKSVVTANKQLIAHCGPELLELAQKMGQQLAFGASVAGGVPVVSVLQDGLAGDRLVKVCGILNGTCNYVLTQIESAGTSMAAAIADAQRLGFAEADPTEDVAGLDAAAKLAILARVAFQAQLQVKDVLRCSICDIEPVDFVYAGQLGCTIRQISRAELNGNSVFAAVQPALAPLASPLARVQGNQNLVIATGEFGGETVFSGFGAGGDPTAVAVVSDLLGIARGKSATARPLSGTACSVSNDFVAPHYVRFTVRDRPGIIASLAAVFSQHQINIDSVLQKAGYPKSRLPFVITFEACGASVLERALQEVRRMDFLVQPPVSLPILG